MDTIKAFRCGLVDTPCGRMLAAVNEAGALTSLEFPPGQPRPNASTQRVRGGTTVTVDEHAVAQVADQIGAYFSNTALTFSLELSPAGTDFMQRHWRLLQTIPFGRVTTYGRLAREIAPPSSPRAVGRANALNPIAIIVPCHRVVGYSGELTGYEGGLDRKARLLRHEGVAVIKRNGVYRAVDFEARIWP